MANSRGLWIVLAVAGALALFTARVRAASEDASKLYELGIHATPTLAKGATGTVTVRITPKPPGEYHKEPPFTLQLTPSGNLAVSKESLSNSDVKMDGTAATVEVPFTAAAAGTGTIDATLSFYICTATRCSPQKRQVSLPVAVR